MVDLALLGVVAVGAAVGGALRLAVSLVVVSRFGPSAAPLATLGVNLVGSFAIGIVIGVARQHGGISPLGQAFLTTGVLGGFTTFSTFSWDIVSMAGPNVALAFGYALTSVIGGVGAAYAGFAMVGPR